MSLLCFNKNIQYNFSKVKEIYPYLAYSMYFFFFFLVRECIILYISPVFLQNDSKCCSGCWWILHPRWGETQLADEMWFHVLHLHPLSGRSQEYPGSTSQICLITNDARRCHGFSFANAGMTGYAELIILQNLYDGPKSDMMSLINTCSLVKSV